MRASKKPRLWWSAHDCNLSYQILLCNLCIPVRYLSAALERQLQPMVPVSRAWMDLIHQTCSHRRKSEKNLRNGKNWTCPAVQRQPWLFHQNLWPLTLCKRRGNWDNGWWDHLRLFCLVGIKCQFPCQALNLELIGLDIGRQQKHRKNINKNLDHLFTITP